MILAKTIKGYGMGEAGEGQNITHQQKKMNEEALLAFRDRFELAAHRRARSTGAFFHRRPRTRPRCATCASAARRSAGSLPARGARRPSRCPTPPSRSRRLLEGTGDREISTTMAFVRDPHHARARQELGPRVVPIVPDESRTFGMEGMFRQLGIFSQVGQLYQPEDADQLMFYREDKRRPDPPGGHQRAGRVLVVDRRGDRRTPTTASR